MLCPSCNTSEDYEVDSKENTGLLIFLITRCKCGRLVKRTTYQKYSDACWLDRKLLETIRY